jgi:tetratricopeptide (TPR) repeat protein
MYLLLFALDAAESCPGARSTDPVELTRRGWQLTADGDAAAALPCHLLATAHGDPSRLQWFHRARTEQALGDEAAARASYSRSVAEGAGAALPVGEEQEAQFQLGRMHREAGALAESERAYRRVLALGEASGAHIMLAVVLRERGLTEEALHHYSTGLAINPAIPAAHFNRAQAYIALSRPEEAAEGLSAAIRLDPAFGVAYEALGELQASLGRPQAAMRSLRSLLTIEPRSASAYYAMGKLHFNAKQLAQARGMYSGRPSVWTPSQDSALTLHSLGRRRSPRTARRSPSRPSLRTCTTTLATRCPTCRASGRRCCTTTRRRRGCCRTWPRHGTRAGTTLILSVASARAPSLIMSGVLPL